MRAQLALIAEPDEETRDLYGGVLTKAVSEIDYAEDGREALAKAIGYQPALVIAETRLAFIDGCVLCSLLRSDPLTADVSIIIVTDDANASGIARARSAGADSVLTKPIVPDTLLQAVARGRSHLPRSDEPCGRPNDQGAASIAPDDSRAGRSRLMVKAHHRFETSTPPTAPPPLRCPSCGQALQYLRSHIGGVSARHCEQWDYYTCPNACGTFQYRQRTRRLRRVE